VGFKLILLSLDLAAAASIVFDRGEEFF